MKIRKIEDKDIQAIINFNIAAYKERDKIEESIYYRFNNNPFIHNSTSEILISEDENKTIIGQTLLMPSEFSFKGKIYQASWEMDSFVDKSFRGLAGAVLTKKALEVKYQFGLGLTKVSLELHLAFGARIEGYMTKYLKLNNIFSLFRFMFIIKKKKSKTFIFPELLNVKGGRFIRVYNPEEIMSPDGYWNADLLEFTRCEKFMNWRFFYYTEKYFVYKYFSDIKGEDSKPTYFVVRPIVWKKVNCLLLVDYRFSFDINGMFDKILKSTTELTRKLKMVAVIAGCSLPSIDRNLRKNWFFKFGEKMVIVTNFLYNKESTDLKKDTIIVTFADSDCDFYYGNNKW